MRKISEGIIGLAHIGIPVSNLEVSKDFYIRILDFDIMHENCIDSEEGRIKVCFMEKKGLVLELYQTTAETKARGDGRYDHVAYKVKNIEEVKDYLFGLGIEFISKDITYCKPLFKNGAKWISFRGPDGEIIELNEIL